MLWLVGTAGRPAFSTCSSNCSSFLLRYSPWAAYALIRGLNAKEADAAASPSKGALLYSAFRLSNAALVSSRRLSLAAFILPNSLGAKRVPLEVVIYPSLSVFNPVRCSDDENDLASLSSFSCFFWRSCSSNAASFSLSVIFLSGTVDTNLSLASCCFFNQSSLLNT